MWEHGTETLYKIVTPRDDLKEGRPLDAAEFAVNLDLVRNGLASEDYLDPKQFFKRTYLTENLMGLAAEVIRRLSGERTQTSAVFNLATQFGGGKTHSLTLLYHLAKEGPVGKQPSRGHDHPQPCGNQHGAQCRHSHF